MLNFLQQKNKKQIIIEYLLRAFVLLLSSILIISLVITILFLPSFFFSKYKNISLNNQLQSVKTESSSLIDDPILLIKNTNKFVQIFAQDNISPIKSTDIINKITSLKNKDIKILSINIRASADINFARTIQISGVANTRDSLTLFEKAIKDDGFFYSVIFPVANFIKSTDSAFTATLTLK